MKDRTLFELPEESPLEEEKSSPSRDGKPRLASVNRRQVVMRCLALDSLIPEDHKARIVWAYVEGLDLSPVYEEIGSVEGSAGRPATDPKILMALWLYATLDGVGSARKLDRLCRDHVAYQWLCGDVPMNYHTLSDFRTVHVEFLDGLLTRSVALLSESAEGGNDCLCACDEEEEFQP